MKKLLIVAVSLVFTLAFGCGILGVSQTGNGKDGKTGTAVRTGKTTGQATGQKTAATGAPTAEPVETAGPVENPETPETPENPETPAGPEDDASSAGEPQGTGSGIPMEQLLQMIENKIREQLTKSDAIKQAVANHINDMLKESQEAISKEIAAKLEKPIEEMRSDLAQLSQSNVTRVEFKPVQDAVKKLTSAPPIDADEIAKKAVDAVRDEIKNAAASASGIPPEKIKELEDANTALSEKIDELEKNVKATQAKPAVQEESGFQIPAVGVIAGFAVVLAIVGFLFMRGRGMKGAASDAVNRVTEMESRVRDLDRRLKDGAITDQKITKRLARIETQPAGGGSGTSSRKYKLSEEMLSKMLSGGEKRVKHLFSIGESFLEMEDCETAIEWFDACLEIDPKFAPAWVEKGVALAKLQEYDDALKTLYNATKLDGQAGRAWYNIACVALLKGDRALMFKAMRESVAQDTTAMDRFRHDKLFSQFYSDPQFLQIVG